MDFILSLAAAQGILLIIVLYTRKFADKKTTHLLGALLILTVLILIGRITWQPEFLKQYWAFVSLPDALLFLFGPLVYFLAHRILKLPMPSRSWLHFIPAFIQIFILNTILGLILIDRMPNMDMTHLIVMYKLIEAAGILSCGIYLWLAYQLYRKNHHHFAQEYAGVNTPVFLKHTLIIGLILIGLWAISYGLKLMGIYAFMDYSVYNAFWICTVFAIYLLAYQLLANARLFDLPPTRPNKRLFTTTPAEKERILTYLQKEKPYLNPDLNLTDLAHSLNLSRNELSAIINGELGMNFFDLINTYRVNAFITAYQHADEKATFIEIAYRVGFNSKSVFYRAFKKLKGTTPSHFFEKKASHFTQ